MDLKSHCTAVEQLCECSFSPELCQVHTHVDKYPTKQIFSLCPSYQVHMTQLQMFKQVCQTNSYNNNTPDTRRNSIFPWRHGSGYLKFKKCLFRLDSWREEFWFCGLKRHLGVKTHKKRQFLKFPCRHLLHLLNWASRNSLAAFAFLLLPHTISPRQSVIKAVSTLQRVESWSKIQPFPNSLESSFHGIFLYDQGPLMEFGNRAVRQRWCWCGFLLPLPLAIALLSRLQCPERF